MPDPLPQRAPRALVLDVGGTLLREERYDLSLGVRTFLERTEMAGGPTAAADVEDWVSDLESVDLATGLLPDRELCLDDWLRSRLPIAPADAAVAELAIWLATVELSPVEGAHRALEVARSRGLRLGVLSNTVFSGRTLEFELRRRGFEVPFEFVITSADVGLRKPALRPFRAALARLGPSMDPGDVWFVGDSWSSDVVGAAGAGMRAVWLGGGEPEDGDTPHLCVRTWKDLVAILESLG